MDVRDIRYLDPLQDRGSLWIVTEGNMKAQSSKERQNEWKKGTDIKTKTIWYTCSQCLGGKAQPTLWPRKGHWISKKWNLFRVPWLKGHMIGKIMSHVSTCLISVSSMLSGLVSGAVTRPPNQGSMLPLLPAWGPRDLCEIGKCHGKWWEPRWKVWGNLNLVPQISAHINHCNGTWSTTWSCQGHHSGRRIQRRVDMSSWLECLRNRSPLVFMQFFAGVLVSTAAPKNAFDFLWGSTLLMLEILF